MSSTHTLVHELFSSDWSRVQWSQLFSSNEFRWSYEITPFSHIQVPFFGTIGYLISIYILQHYMKDRKPYNLKWFSLYHNLYLAVLSLVMFIGSSIGVYEKFQSQGLLDGLLCEKDPDPMKGTLFYWSYIFYLSKYIEFIDTYLLILKKKPLLFLHVYHHFVMPWTCWAGLHGNWCMALWLSAFWNSLVHVIMYTYFFFTTLGYSFWWKNYITLIQISQFVMGVGYTTSYFYFYLQDFHISLGGPWLLSISYTQGCVGELWAILGMYFVNCSFLVLFVKWYFDAYKEKSHSRENIKANQENGTKANRPKRD